MLHSEIQGTHEPGASGTGCTLQELYELLRSLPRKARQNYIMTQDGEDVTGLHFAQSDQAEKWDFNVYIATTKGDGSGRS